MVDAGGFHKTPRIQTITATEKVRIPIRGTRQTEDEKADDTGLIRCTKANFGLFRSRTPDSKLRCTCDEEEESDEGLKYPTHKGREVSGTLSLGRKVPDTESSYLHLERADSQRLSFTEQLKGWSEASLKGEPYDKHSKNKNPVPLLDTDSENSVSPALSLVSLSETDSDREIARHLYDSQPSTITNGSLTRQMDAVALPRAVTKLRSVDSESSSDEQGKSGFRDRTRETFTACL